MKIFEEIVVPEKKHIVCLKKKCDLCGFEVTKESGENWSSDGFYCNETEIVVRSKNGYNCSDGGSGTLFEIHICPKCFKDKLIPWLKSQGANLKEEEWDW